MRKEEEEAVKWILKFDKLVFILMLFLQMLLCQHVGTSYS